MSRVILENNMIYAPTIKTGLRKAVMLKTITGNVTLVAGMPVILAFDPTNTDRTITMEAVPTVAAGGDGVEHEIIHFGTGTGRLLINNPAASQIGVVYPGGRAVVKVINGVWVCFFTPGSLAAGVGQDEVITYYTKLADIANAQILAVTVPFPFKLVSVGFRVRIAATTASKLATLTAQVNGVSVTGGVIALTSANATPSGTLVAGSAITAGNVGAANQTVGVLASAVTAFAEGDGTVEFQVQNVS